MNPVLAKETNPQIFLFFSLMLNFHVLTWYYFIPQRTNPFSLIQVVYLEENTPKSVYIMPKRAVYILVSFDTIISINK